MINTPDQTAKARIGIVLSSGGIRGIYAHTGFIQALEELNINVQAVAGCSAGAVVGGVFSSGKNTQEWAKALSVLKPRRFWRPKWIRLLMQLLVHRGKGLTGLSSMEAAKDFCKSQIEVERIEDCKIPFSSLAINIETGKKKFLKSGDLASAMVASAAIPILYQPVEIDGEYYSDGALVNFAPTDAICCGHNLDILILHYVACTPKKSLNIKRAVTKAWTLFEILGKLLYRKHPWYLTGEPISLQHCPCKCGAEIIVIEPELADLSWPLTASGMKILESARKQSVELLAQHRDAITQGDKKSLSIILSKGL